MSIESESQKLEQDALVSLFILDATVCGAGILCFTDSVDGSQKVVWNGQEFTPLNFESEGWEWAVNSALPRPRIKLSNVDNVVGGLTFAYGDLLGSTLTRIRTYAAFLDNGSSPDPEQVLPKDIYTVDRKVHHDLVYIEWELVSVLDLENVLVQARQILSDACPHVYRYWNGSSFVTSKSTCQYAGSSYFDEYDKPTTPDKDKCGRKLTSCKLRFGENAQLPTWQFPSAGRNA
jgi:lambda family phage minor tail protein L